MNRPSRERLQAFQDRVLSHLLVGSPNLATSEIGVDVCRFRLVAKLVSGKRVAKCQHVLPRTFETARFSSELLNLFCNSYPYLSSDYFGNAMQFYRFIRTLSKRGMIKPYIEEVAFAELALAANTKRRTVQATLKQSDSDWWRHLNWMLEKGVRIRQFEYDIFPCLEGSNNAQISHREVYGLFTKPRGELSGRVFKINKPTYSMLLDLRGSRGKMPSYLFDGGGRTLVKWLYLAGAVTPVQIAQRQ